MIHAGSSFAKAYAVLFGAFLWSMLCVSIGAQLMLSAVYFELKRRGVL